MGTLILVRHATTAHSASGRNLGQGSDPPLADTGLELAESLGSALAMELAELPHDEIRLISSPALRCRQTMAGVVSGLGLDPEDVELAPDLIELDYGAWDGLTAAECLARDPELRALWEADPYTTSCPDGESGKDVAARATGVLDPVVSWLAADRARCAVAMAHNHVNRVVLCRLLGWPMRDYRRRLAADPGSYSMVTFGSANPVIRRFNVPGR